MKRKVTFTIFVDEKDDRKAVGRKIIARRIRATAIRKGEKMAEWADHLNVSPQYISQVVNGRRKAKEIREFIESRLGERFWEQDAA